MYAFLQIYGQQRIKPSKNMILQVWFNHLYANFDTKQLSMLEWVGIAFFIYYESSQAAGSTIDRLLAYLVCYTT